MTSIPPDTGSTTNPLGSTGTEIPEIYRSGRAKRNAARNRRYLAYAVLLVALGGAAFKIDWATIGEQYFNGPILRKQFPKIITVAAKNTLAYTLAAFIGGVVLGTSMALLRNSPIRLFRWLSAIFIEVFRGLPALLTIYLIGQYTPQALGFTWPTVSWSIRGWSLGTMETGGVIALAMVAGAYLAETIRAGIQAVDPGQIEAARSLGLSRSATMRTVVLPQAFRIVIPPLTNELVLLLKDTSLISALGVTPFSKELTKFGRDATSDAVNVTPLIAAGIMYLIITIPLTQLVAHLERRNARIR